MGHIWPLIMLRWEKGWTQDERAHRIFVSRNAVSNYEIGRRMPEREIIKYCSGVRRAARLSASGIPGKRAEQEKRGGITRKGRINRPKP